MTDIDIETIAVNNGFKRKQQPNGLLALNPYVFDFARALLAHQAQLAAPQAVAPYTITPITKNFKSGDNLAFAVATAQPLPVNLCVFLQSQPSGADGNFMFGQPDTENGNLSEQITIYQPVQLFVTSIVFTDEHRPFERKFKILLLPELMSPVSEAVGASEVLTLPKPTPTYTIQRIDPEGDRLTVWRGKQVSYAITAQNLLGGAGTVYVTIDGGRVQPTDITEGVITASIEIVGRKALLVFSASYPGFGDLPFVLSVRTGSITGPIVAQCLDQVIRSTE